MKEILSIFILQLSFGQELCPDEDLNQKCIALCDEDYASCGQTCSGEKNCFELCSESYSGCVRDCPCEKNCPSGCVNCQNPICDSDEQAFLTVLGDQPFTDRTQYVMAVDGSLKMETRITTPDVSGRHDYLKYAGHAMLNGELYIFGGSSNFNKIARLDDCEFKELPIQLEDRFDSVSGALMTFSNKVFLCFFAWPYTSCEEFDGEQTFQSNLTTNHAHCYGSLGVYNDQLLAIGAGDWPGEGVRNKVEILDGESWHEIADYPLDIQLASTITVPEGMLVIGGWNQESGSLRENPNSGGFYKQVYLLSENVWSLVGNLNEPVSDSSVIRVGEWIVSIAGDSGNNNVERFKWTGQEVQNVETIGKHSNTILRPIVFQSSKNFCAVQNL